MNKITIRNDLLFKYVFGRNTKECIQSLTWVLSQILHKEIRQLYIMNPVALPDSLTQKMVAFDIAVTYNDGENAIIEMQMKKNKMQNSRFLYYLSKAHYSQNMAGEDYNHIKKTTLILFTDFSFTEDEEIVHHNLMRDELGNIFDDKFELITIELGKIKPNLVTKENIKEKSGMELFFYYLKYCDDEDKRSIIEIVKEQEGAISMIDDTYRNIPREKLEAFQQLSKEMAEDKLYFMGEAAGEAKGEAKGILSERTKNLKSLLNHMSLNQACTILDISEKDAKQLLNESI